MIRKPALSGPEMTGSRRRLGDHHGLRETGRRVAERKADDVGGDADGRVAHQQAGDQRRDAVPRLAPGGERSIEPGRNRRGEERGDGEHWSRRRQIERDQRSDQAADHHLPVAAEIDHPAAERDRGNERHADKRHSPVQRVRQISRRKRADQDFDVRLERVCTGDEDQNSTNDNREDDGGGDGREAQPGPPADLRRSGTRSRGLRHASGHQEPERLLVGLWRQPPRPGCVPRT